MLYVDEIRGLPGKRTLHSLPSFFCDITHLPNRQEAFDLLKKNPFFQAWDPAVLQIYIECGIYLTKDEYGKEIAKLKMPGILEGVVFADVHTAYEVYERLVNLDERIALRWLMPGKPGAPELGKPGTTKYRVWVRPKNSTNVKILGGGHLVRQRSRLSWVRVLIRCQKTDSSRSTTGVG